MGIYFRTDTTRLSYGELWRLSSRIPVFITACLNKIFRVRAPVRWAIRHDDSITVLPADKVSLDAMRALEPLIDGFQQLAARLAFFQTIHTTENLESYAAVLLPLENNAVISCAWSRARISNPGKEGACCGLTSLLQDDTFLSTTNRHSPLDTPPGFRVMRWRSATPSELSLRHEDALAKSGSWPIPVCHEDDAKKILLEVKRRNFDWKISRGVYVPLTTEEQARLGLPDKGES